MERSNSLENGFWHSKGGQFDFEAITICLQRKTSKDRQSSLSWQISQLLHSTHASALASILWVLGMALQKLQSQNHPRRKAPQVLIQSILLLRGKWIQSRLLNSDLLFCPVVSGKNHGWKEEILVAVLESRSQLRLGEVDWLTQSRR